MKTIYLDVEDDKLEFILSFIKNLKTGIVKNIVVEEDGLDIEPISKDSSDYREIVEIKSQNNEKYSIEEAEKFLGLE